MMDAAKKTIQENSIEFIRAEFADVHGICRNLILDADFFIRSAEKGIPFVKGLMAHGVKGHLPIGSGLLKEIGFPNALMYPDYDSFRILPWVENTASVLVDFNVQNSNGGEHRLQNPRMHCKQQLEDLSKLGFNLYSAFEYEFYVVNKNNLAPLDNDVNIFTMQKNNRDTKLLYDIMRNLKKTGINTECMHSEYGPGQYEITTCPVYGIQAADNAYCYKHIVKEISLQHGYMSSFMSKPYNNESGCSGHFNHSLWYSDSKTNAMHDENRTNKMSLVAEHWLAGLIYHSGALMALSAPTVNCYKRIVSNSFAPVNNTWAVDNRSVAYRFKNYDVDQTYIEDRVPSGAVNPYLVMAGVVIAGMDGIKRELKLGEAVRGSAYDDDECPEGTETLPKNLKESLKHLCEDKVFCTALGTDFIKCFTAVKNLEISQADQAKDADRLSTWEKEFYFEYL